MLTVEKQDSEDQVPLPGAEFQLWRETNGVDGLQTGGENPDATVGEPCTTGAEGTCEQSVTEPGTYYWQETAAPEGYDLPENPVVGPVEVTAENISQGSRVEADNTRSAEPDNTVRVEKRDAEDGSPLPGAEFQLWRETNGTAGLQTGGENPDTAVGDRCTTDGEGVCAETVTSTGTYYWEETAVPEGYEMPADTVIGPVEVTEPGQTYEVTADNQKTPEPGPDPDPDPDPNNEDGPLRIDKRDGESGARLPGAEFQLWRETNGVEGLQTGGGNPDTTVGEPCTTGALGRCERTVSEPGAYYWQETAAPEGYDLPENTVTGPVEVTAENIGRGQTSEADNARSQDPDSTVRVEKRDKESGARLPGAEFQLWRETNGTAGLQTGGENPDTAVGGPCTTGGRGVCEETVTSTGTYYWEETAAPDGYELPRDTVTGPVEVTEPGQTYRVTADNRKAPEPGPGPDPKGDIRLDKTDRKNGEPLPGAVFQLWRETNGTAGLQTGGGDPDTRTGSACATDDKGRCSFDELPLGTYYLEETAVPEGYELPADPVSGPYELTAGNAGKGLTVPLENTRGEPGKGEGKGDNGGK
ncbi:hypothetical protein HCC30_19230 [Streptomyces sp. HNM0574]|nr:hypothetical protein [Streptomyces sp. HNM0574]